MTTDINFLVDDDSDDEDFMTSVFDNQCCEKLSHSRTENAIKSVLKLEKSSTSTSCKENQDEAMLASIYPGVSTDSIRSAIKNTKNLDNAANFLAGSSLKTPFTPQDIIALL